MAAQMHPAPDLSARINAFRLASDVSARELARRCGVSRQHMTDLLAGRRLPTVEMARRLVFELEVPPLLAAEILDAADRSYRSGAGFGVVETLSTREN
jgi:transcriptional regulator with XRE-family HTH domain